jgi:transcriptional regulator with XRE-family HTH domain
MSGHRKWNEIRTETTREDREPLRTLAELRRESGLNQQEMADEIGVSQASVSKAERQDDPQVSTLMRYLGVLGANLELRAVFPDRTVRLYFLADVEATADGAAGDARAPGHAEGDREVRVG